MKRFMLCLLLFPMAVMAQVPSYPVRLDLQSPSRTFALKWAAGSSPILSAYVSDGGRAYTNLSGWTGYVYVAVTPTAGVYVAASPVASNRVDFSFTAAQTATVGTFGVEVVLGNGTNTYRWGTGSLSLSNSPALLGAGTVPLTGVFNWDLFTFTGTQPPLSASYTNTLAGDVTGVPGATEIASGVVGTNELSSEVLGLIADGGLSSNSVAKAGDSMTGNLVFTNGAIPQVVGNGSPGLYLGPQGAGPASSKEITLAADTGMGLVSHKLYGDVTGKLKHNDGLGNTLTVWDSGSDGAGSGLDADTLDGINSTTLTSAIASASATGTAAYALAAAASPLVTTITTSGGELDGDITMTRNVNDSRRIEFKTAGTISMITATGALFAVNQSSTFGSGNTALPEPVWVWSHALFPPSTNRFWGTWNFNTGAINSATLGGYLPTDFALLTTLSTGGYIRITSGAVTSNSAAGTRGEFRRSTTNAYFHDGSQWVTWSVSTNFSH